MAIAHRSKMPLTPSPEGVHFIAEGGQHAEPVHCVVTRAALEAVAGRRLAIAELEDVFWSHHSVIRIATKCALSAPALSGYTTTSVASATYSARRVYRTT